MGRSELLKGSWRPHAQRTSGLKGAPWVEPGRGPAFAADAPLRVRRMENLVTHLRSNECDGVDRGWEKD